jgi:hypothetical protein
MTTMTTVIDTARALELLDLAVEARGADFRYQEEFGTEGQYLAYRDRDADEIGEMSPDSVAVPACLIAEALIQHGCTTDDLTQIEDSMPMLAGFDQLPGAGHDSGFDYRSARDFANRSLLDLGEAELGRLGIQLTEGAARTWWAAQRVQDRNDTWGAAREAAHEVAALLTGRP